MLAIFQNLFGKTKKVKNFLENGAIILDVRTPAEFQQGHVRGSINIPLDAVSTQIEVLKKKGNPIVTCCRSGMRSGVAAGMLRSAGLEVINGGSWQQVENAKSR